MGETKHFGFESDAAYLGRGRQGSRGHGGGVGAQLQAPL